MDLTTQKLEQIKTLANDRKVTFFLAENHVINGKIKEINTDYLKVESDFGIVFFTPDKLIALMIEKK
jgi:hypothetical protein